MNLDQKAKLLSDRVTVPEKIRMTTFSMDEIKEGFSKQEISKETVLGFDPEEETLYQDCSEPSLEAFQSFKITDIKTGKSQKIDLGQSYKYIDAIKLVNGSLHFIGSNTEASADYIEMQPNGKLKKVNISNFDRIAVFPSETGFYVNLEKNLSQNRIETSLIYIEYGTDKGEALAKATCTVGEEGFVKEGHLFSNFYAMGSTIGFQELEDFSGNTTKTKASYLLNIKDQMLYEIPFVNRLSTYLVGNEDFIVNLKAFKPEGDIEEDRCIIYKKDGTEYKPYILPGYEFSNFIREAKILEDGRLFIHGDFSLDFVSLDSMEGKKISLKQENLGPAFFTKDSYLSFVEIGEEKDYLYWGLVENK